jgi:hypothetical protein
VQNALPYSTIVSRWCAGSTLLVADVERRTAAVWECVQQIEDSRRLDGQQVGLCVIDWCFQYLGAQVLSLRVALCLLQQLESYTVGTSNVSTCYTASLTSLSVSGVLVSGVGLPHIAAGRKGALRGQADHRHAGGGGACGVRL